MNKRLLLLGGILVGIGSLVKTEAQAAHSNLRSHDQVLWYTSTAQLASDGKTWEADVHGCVYEPEDHSVFRQAALKSLMESTDLSTVDTHSPLFQERSQYFLVDHHRYRFVTLQIAGKTYDVGPSESNGHLRATLSLPVIETAGAAEEKWVDIQSLGGPTSSRTFSGRLHLIPPEGLSVISDVDDTIKETGVGDPKVVLSNTFAKPYVPITGMSDLYRAWAANGVVFHYVSASPWQLYPALSSFLKENHFPEGDFSLKYFRLKSRTAFSLFQDPAAYKLPLLRDILRRYPKRTFILVGDSGERDPEIYGIIAREFGAQIHSIAIRDVHPNLPDPARYEAAFKGLPKTRWQLFVRPEELTAVGNPGIL